MARNLLIIRFSSIGDILQCLSVPNAFHLKFPASNIDWLVRSDNAFLLQSNPHIINVVSFSRDLGIWGLIKLGFELRKNKYTHIYDAHNNLRSRIISWILVFGRWGKYSPWLVRRSKHRFKRFLLFTLRINTFPKPFLGQSSYLEPLVPWLGTAEIPPSPQLFLSDETLQYVQKKINGTAPFIALVPSAAWEMKRWPIEHWKKLIFLLPNENFVLIGGPMDHFCAEIAAIAPQRVQNLCGKLTLIESCAVIQLARLTISADTGFLHAADQLGKEAIALIGPTAFGYPSRPTTKVLEVNSLKCRPCTKDGSGKCTQKIYKRCLVEITPQIVAGNV